MTLSRADIGPAHHHGGFAPWASGQPSASRAELITLRRLRSEVEIREVAGLREAIDLSAHDTGSAGFTALEKKETSSAWSARLNSKVTS